MKNTLTQEQYNAFQEAYNFLNRELFQDSLPPVLVTLQRHAKAYGYFAPERFTGRGTQEVVHELALNPDHFGRTDAEILSTLAHEMVHVWQETHGTPPRKSYHDKEWSNKMKEIGLQPSDTGEPGGRETGQSMTHYIIENGAFAQSAARLKATGFLLRWQSQGSNGFGRKKKAASKTKYTCPSCEMNVWGKPEMSIICGHCYEDEGELLMLIMTKTDL